MAESKTWAWIKSNAVAITVPLASGAIALMVSYTTSIKEETLLYNRIAQLEAQVTSLEKQDEEIDDDMDNMEDNLKEADRAIRLLITNGDSSVRDLVITEGRDLERKVIRLDTRVDAINRRLTYLDGIGAPSYGPGFDYIPGEDVE